MRTIRQIIFTIINSFAQPLTAYTAFIFQVISSFLSNLMLIPIFRLIINFFDQIRINVGSFFIQMYDTIFSFISSLFNPVQFLYENVFKKIYGVEISNRYLRYSKANETVNMSKKQHKQLANDMGHSISQSL
jgi:phage-related protein